MIGIFIWTMIFLFTGVFIGYAIGSYLEMQKREEPRTKELKSLEVEKMSDKQSNADRIRNMSDEELAEVMPCPYMKDMYDECVHGWHDYDCGKCKLEWLQSEAE